MARGDDNVFVRRRTCVPNARVHTPARAEGDAH